MNPRQLIPVIHLAEKLARDMPRNIDVLHLRHQVLRLAQAVNGDDPHNVHMSTPPSTAFVSTRKHRRKKRATKPRDWAAIKRRQRQKSKSSNGAET